jgi:hypothetical protein
MKKNLQKDLTPCTNTRYRHRSPYFGNGGVPLFRIDPRIPSGRWYVIGTVLSCLTSFAVMKTGHLSPAHGLSVLVLILIPLALYSRRLFGARGPKLETILMSSTLLFSFIPAVTETLTRVPLSHPVAENQDAPVLKICYLCLLILFSIGLFLQLRKPQPAAAR